ncbi:hypothetical protein Tco_0246367 [Tanacetum coccineum]
MADLEFVDQHNMVACLEKTGGNSEFHEIVDFLTSSLIHHALTVSPTIYISYIEQFWNTASSQTVNDEKQIHATVDSKAVVVTEASIRSSLLLNDADGTACLTNEAIFQNLALMGYEGELNKLTFQKALFSPQWKYLIHTILHCLSSKSTSWNEFSTNIASAVICLATNQKFNFSKLVFDGMLRNLDTSKKKFLMYPRFLMVFLNNQIELGEPFNDVYVTPAHTQKVFSNMSRKGVKFSGKVTPLFDCMLVPHQAPEGEGSDQPTEPQPTPSPTHPSIGDQPPVTASSPSHATTQDSRDSLEGTNGNAGDQGTKKSKLESTLDDSTVFDDQDADHGMEYMENEEAMDEGRQSGETKEVKLTDDTEVVEDKGNEDSAIEPRTPPITTSIFDDEDITMAQTLIKMKKEKAKEIRVSIKDVDDSSRPARSILTLKPLPTIDPKEKIAKDAEIARLIDASEELAARLQMEVREMYIIEERHNQLNKKTFKEIQALYIKEQERDADFVPTGSERDEKIMDKMNTKAAGIDEEEVPKEPETTKVEVKQEGREENNMKRSEEEQLRASLKIVPDEEEEIDYEVLECLELMEVQDISRLSLKWFQDLIDWTSLSYIMMIFGRIKRNGLFRVGLSMKTMEFISA